MNRNMVKAFNSSNRTRELRTVDHMIHLYCRHHHGTEVQLCPSCLELLAYARQRLLNCPYGEEKPTCAKCPIHCYKPDVRVKIRDVMRYAGPRMLMRHPVLAVRHLVKEKFSTRPSRPTRNAKSIERQDARRN